MKTICFKCLLQFDNLSLDQDMLSLRKECQEKDATIKDLTSFLQLTNKACSKVRLCSCCSISLRLCFFHIS